MARCARLGCAIDAHPAMARRYGGCCCQECEWGKENDDKDAEIAKLREQLAAERERCARVAETTNVVSDGQAGTWFDGVERALLTVAANIRRGEEW